MQLKGKWKISHGGVVWGTVGEHQGVFSEYQSNAKRKLNKDYKWSKRVS